MTRPRIFISAVTSEFRSARLFSEVGLAILAMLYHSGVQTVLPPGYLCCGYQPLTQGCVPIIKGWARSR